MRYLTALAILLLSFTASADTLSNDVRTSLNAGDYFEVFTGGTNSKANINWQNLSGSFSDIVVSGSGAFQSITTGAARIGGVSDSTTFEADGTMVFNGSATVFNDIIIQASNLRPGASAPDFAAFQNNIYASKFENAQSDVAYGAFEIPHMYQEGTPLEVHLHWSPSSTNTGDMAITFEYTFAAMNGAAAFGTSATLSAAQAGSGTTNKHQYLSAGVIPGAGRKIGDIIVFALSRPTGDSFTGDMFLHSIGIHYAADTLGSRTVSGK